MSSICSCSIMPWTLHSAEMSQTRRPGLRLLVARHVDAQALRAQRGYEQLPFCDPRGRVPDEEGLLGHNGKAGLLQTGEHDALIVAHVAHGGAIEPGAQRKGGVGEQGWQGAMGPWMEQDIQLLCRGALERCQAHPAHDEVLVGQDDLAGAAPAADQGVDECRAVAPALAAQALGMAGPGPGPPAVEV